MSENLYTPSRLRLIRQCLRLHYYRYILGLDGGSTRESEFGTVGHFALEVYFRAWQLCDREQISNASDFRIAAAYDAIAKSELGPWDRAKARLLVNAYDARWGGEDWEILEIEVQFRYMLGEHLHGGKIDVLIRDRKDGRVYVVEHKTTGADTSLGGPYWERLQLDSQVSIYIDGASMLGYEIAGCIYDVLKRPAHEQKLATPLEAREYTQGKGCKFCGGKLTGGVQGSGKSSATSDGRCAVCRGSGWRLDEHGNPEAPRLHKNQREHDETIEQFEARLTAAISENPDAFLMRGIVVRLESELPKLRQDTLDTIEIERFATLREMYPRNDSACARGHHLCPFFEICVGRAQPHQFPRVGAHPELQAADQT